MAHRITVVTKSETLLPDGSTKTHQVVTVTEMADTPQELLWKYRRIVDGAKATLDGMADMAVEALAKGESKGPWEK